MSLTASTRTAPDWSTPPPTHLPHYGIGFLAAIRRGFTKYATFEGRASLSEFWWWSLFRALTALVVITLGYGGIAVTTALGTGDDLAGAAVIMLYLTLLGFDIGTYLPTLAITFRRLHDAGRNPAWFLISFVPLVGWLILLCLLAERTSAAAYRFGPPFIMIDPSRPGWTPQYAPSEG